MTMPPKCACLIQACGSGSFLTGEYQYPCLIGIWPNYRENPQRYKNRIRHSADGIILLTSRRCTAS